MKKHLLYRLFGLGKINYVLKKQLHMEGIELIDEGLSGSVTYIKFKAEGKYFRWKRRWHIASIVLTKKRIIGIVGKTPIINIGRADEKLNDIEFSNEGGNVLLVSLDAESIYANGSGRIEFRFKSEHAKAIIRNLEI